MAFVNISVPDQMKLYIEDRISQGGYSTTSEYFRDLVRDDQKKQAEERLESMLLRGLDSPASEWTEDDVDHIKNAVRERLAAKHAAGRVAAYSFTTKHDSTRSISHST